MIKDTVVTAIYLSSPFSKMGGRGFSWDHYKGPFRNLLYLNCNIVVYTDDASYDGIVDFFKEHNFLNYKLIKKDLEEYRHSELIYELKEKEGIINKDGLLEEVSVMSNNRNTHLCLSKIDFLLNTIENKYFDTENYFWVDGGLFHHGLIPEKLGGVERYTNPPDSRYWPENTNSVCNPDFFTKLNAKKLDRLVLLGLFPGHGRHPVFEDPEICKNPKRVHIVGGLFGGERDMVLDLCNNFNITVDKVLSRGVNTLEEDILCVMYSDFYENQGYFEFTQWSHDMPDQPNYLGAPPGSESFYKIFIHS